MLNTSYKKPIFAVSKDSSRKITKFLVCSALFLIFSSLGICKQLQSVFLEMDTELWDKQNLHQNWLTRGWRDGSEVSNTVCPSRKPWFLGPSRYMWSQLFNSNSWGSDALFCPAQVPGTTVVHNRYVGKTPTYKK